jgi:hypothetical protein
MEPQQEAWRIESIVEGAHLDNPNEPMSELRIRLGPLRAWTCAQPPQVDWGRGSVTVHTEDQVLGVAHLDHATVRLVADHTCSVGGDGATVNRDALFEVEMKTPSGVALREAMKRYVFPLRSLIGFFTMTYTSIEPVTALRAQPSDHPDRSRYVTYRTQLQRPSRLPAQPSTRDMLVTWPMVPFEFQTLIERWFVLVDSQSKAIGMLLMPDWAPYLYADDKLLSAFLAVESYHDKAIGGNAVPQQMHKARVKAIVESAPEEHREWLQNVLWDKNSKSQERKLSEAIERAGSTGRAVLEALPKFAKLAAKSRHKVAHPSEYDVSTGAQFVFLGCGLRWLLRHCVLLDLGLTEEQVTSLIKRLREFENDLQELATLRQASS